MTQVARPLPFDADTERSVLGAIMLQPEGESVLLPRLGKEDFFGDAERTVYSMLLEMSEIGDLLATDSVVARLRSRGLLSRVGGVEYLVEVIGATPAIPPSRMGSFVERLHDLRDRRAIIASCNSLMAEAYETTSEVKASDIAAKAQEQLITISSGDTSNTFHHIKDSVTNLFKDIQAEAAARAAGITTRAPTGIHVLDKMIGGGMRNGGLVILAARSSMGKTAFALTMVPAVLRVSSNPRLGVHVISAETADDRISARLLGADGGIATSNILSGDLGKEQWAKLTTTASWLSKQALSIDDCSSPTLGKIRASINMARSSHMRIGPDGKPSQQLGLVILDYLQLAVNPNKNGTREQEVTSIAYGLLGMAKEFKVPIVALSQLNRGVEGRDNKRPRLNDLRESGGIENAADTVIALYRDDYYNPKGQDVGITEIHVLKQKDGPTGMVKAAFRKDTMKFYDLEEDHED